jgi:hypothetical protein
VCPPGCRQRPDALDEAGEEGGHVGLDSDIRITPEGVSWDKYGFMPSRAEIRAQTAAAGFPEKITPR